MSTTTAQSVRASSPHKTQLFSTSWPLLTFGSLAFATGHPYGILWLLDFARLLNYSGRALLVDIISEYLQFGRDIPMVLWVYKLTCNHHNCGAVDCVCVCTASEMNYPLPEVLLGFTSWADLSPDFMSNKWARYGSRQSRPKNHCRFGGGTSTCQRFWCE